MSFVQFLSTTSRLVSISLAGWNSYGKFLKEIANIEHYLKGQSVRCSESTTEEKTVVVEEAEVAVEQKEVSVERVKEYTPLIGQDTISITDSLLFDNQNRKLFNQGDVVLLYFKRVLFVYFVH